MPRDALRRMAMTRAPLYDHHAKYCEHDNKEHEIRRTEVHAVHYFLYGCLNNTMIILISAASRRAHLLLLLSQYKTKNVNSLQSIAGASHPLPQQRRAA